VEVDNMSRIDQTGINLLPCPFCGGPVQLELANTSRDRIWGDKNGDRHWYGVTCRNTINLGGTCCMDQVPSASKGSAIRRWNMRGGVAYAGQPTENSDEKNPAPK
jgi:hypothetical protein